MGGGAGGNSPCCPSVSNGPGRMQGARGFFNGHESGALEITIRSWTTANVACGIFRWVFRDTSVNIDGSHRSDSRILFSKLTKRALNIFHRRMDVIGYACTQLSLVGWEWKLAVMQIVITLGACWIRTWGHGVESSQRVLNRWRKNRIFRCPLKAENWSFYYIHSTKLWGIIN